MVNPYLIQAGTADGSNNLDLFSLMTVCILKAMKLFQRGAGGLVIVFA